MTKYLVCLYDQELKEYLAFNLVDRLELFKRDVKTLVNDATSKSSIALYPEQFTLFKLATIDSTSGKVLENNVLSLGNCLELKNVSC